MAKLRRYTGSGWELQSLLTNGTDVFYRTVGSGASTEYRSLIDSNHKIVLEALPDLVVGQMVYGGTVFLSGGNVTVALSNNAKTKLGITSNMIQLTAQDHGTETDWYGYNECEGIYFVASSAFIFPPGVGKDYEVGDWLIATASSWEKIDNTDAVSSVNSKTGNVVLTGSDLNYGSGQSTTIKAKIDSMVESISENAGDINDLKTGSTHAGWAIGAGYASKIGTTTVHPAIGSTTRGVYVNSDGTVTQMTYTVEKSVPSNAVFTDTTYTLGDNGLQKIKLTSSTGAVQELQVPWADSSGSASTATVAGELSTARNITVKRGAQSAASFKGNANVTATVAANKIYYGATTPANLGDDVIIAGDLWFDES